jgi:23S rRNA (adenine2503-C2)-methyltransferase
VRNLTAGEICGQVLLAMDELGDWPAGKPERRLTNIVLMGMGEPLFNYDNVAKAMRIVMSGEGVRPVKAANHAVDLGCGAGNCPCRCRSRG